MISYSPSYKAYIPFIYYAWVDSTLSPGEYDILINVIRKDDLVSEKEKRELISFLDKSKPPSEREFDKWRTWIDTSKVELDPQDTYPLSTFIQRLTGKEDVSQVQKVEESLDLRPSKYKHIFPFSQKNERHLSTEERNDLKRFCKPVKKGALSTLYADLNTEVFKWEVIRDKEELRAKTKLQVQWLGKNGYGSIAYASHYGGAGDLECYGMIFEQLVTIDSGLAVKFGVQYGLFGGAIEALGTKKHHDRWLKAIGKGEIFGCFAMTETNHGSNVRGLQTRATYNSEEDSIYINTPSECDNKEYIGNALDAHLAVVFAQLLVKGDNCGVHAIVVPMRDKSGSLLPGIRVEDNGYKLGINGVDNGKIWFKNVCVSRWHLLDRFGGITEEGVYQSEIASSGKRFFSMLGTLVGGRICVGKGAVKGAQHALKIACNYAMERRQFGPKAQKNEELIIDYPSHQLRLLPRLARTFTLQYALTSLLQTYAYERNKGKDMQQLEAQVASLKASATWFSNRTIQECREACGGKGYLIENRIADLKGDIDIFTTFEGDNTVLMQLAAKGVLSEFQSQFTGSGFRDLITYLSMQVQSTLTTINPRYSGRTTQAHLRSSSFHQHALKYRLDDMTMGVANRIRALSSRKINSYDAFLRIQNQVIALGHAYAHHLEIHLFYEFIEKEGVLAGFSDNVQGIVGKLCSLSGLSLISENRLWYLEKGYINASKSKAIRHQIELLSADIRPYLFDIISSLDIASQAKHIVK